MRLDGLPVEAIRVGDDVLDEAWGEERPLLRLAHPRPERREAFRDGIALDAESHLVADAQHRAMNRLLRRPVKHPHRPPHLHR